MTSRSRRIAAILVAAGLVLTSCGSVQQGTALPNDADVGEYVNARFKKTMASLEESVIKEEDKKIRLETFLRLDEKWTHGAMDAARMGSPPKRIDRHTDYRWPDYSIDTYFPAKGKYVYTYVGRVFKRLAPTPWVRSPRQDDYGECHWGGSMKACKIAKAISDSMKSQESSLRQATRQQDNTIEVTMFISFAEFVTNRIIVVPESAAKTIETNFDKERIPTTITFDQNMNLKGISMSHEAKSGDHEIEVDVTYSVLGKPTDRDFPETPKASETTTQTLAEHRKMIDKRYKLVQGDG